MTFLRPAPPPVPAPGPSQGPERVQFGSGQLPADSEYYAATFDELCLEFETSSIGSFLGSQLSQPAAGLMAMATNTFNKKTLGLETVEPAVTPPPSIAGNATFAKKPKLASAKSKKREIPEGLWTKCPKCSTMVFDKELDENLKVCTHCQHHFP